MMNSHVVQDHIRGVQMHAGERFAAAHARENIEAQTDASVAYFFSDRRRTFRFLCGIEKWVSRNCSDLIDALPLDEMGFSKANIAEYAARAIMVGLARNHFGRNKFISAHNVILGDPQLRDEFDLRKDQISHRDFSFVFDQI